MGGIPVGWIGGWVGRYPVLDVESISLKTEDQWVDEFYLESLSKWMNEWMIFFYKFEFCEKKPQNIRMTGFEYYKSNHQIDAY